jgi:hypothetical protein
MKDYSEIISGIDEDIKWLETNLRNTNLPLISERINKLAIRCYHFSNVVSDAYDARGQAEADYKFAKSTFSRNFQGSATAAQGLADSDPTVAAAKQTLVNAENLFNRLKLYSIEFHNILDCFRQRVSVEKQINTKLGYEV